MKIAETDRLILRGWKEDDYLDSYEFMSDERVMLQKLHSYLLNIYLKTII